MHINRRNSVLAVLLILKMALDLYIFFTHLSVYLSFHPSSSTGLLHLPLVKLVERTVMYDQIISRSNETMRVLVLRATENPGPADVCGYYRQ